MRYDREHKERTREKLLEQAAAAIRSKGTDGIGVADVMARAGLTHGAFYAYFKSREDLVEQAIGQAFNERYALFLERCGSEDPRAALEGFITYYLSPAHRLHSDRGCPIPTLMGEVARLPRGTAALFARKVETLVSGLAALIERCGMDDARPRARSMVAELAGAVALSRLVEDEDAAMAQLAATDASIRARLGLG